jgi:Na+/H+-dicarboxylate symporter
MKLERRILFGFAAGVAIGFLSRVDGLTPLQLAVIALEPVGTVFIRLITMVVVPLVIASVFVGVASLGDVRALGRVGGKTLVYFLGTTVLAAIIGLLIAMLAGVGCGNAGVVADADQYGAAKPVCICGAGRRRSVAADHCRLHLRGGGHGGAR